jgi:hypothetical protein
MDRHAWPLGHLSNNVLLLLYTKFKKFHHVKSGDLKISIHLGVRIHIILFSLLLSRGEGKGWGGWVNIVTGIYSKRGERKKPRWEKERNSEIQFHIFYIINYQSLPHWSTKHTQIDLRLNHNLIDFGQSSFIE